MTNSFDEMIEEMFGIKPIKVDRKYVEPDFEPFSGWVRSEEDIERDRARRIEQIRIDARNEVVTSEEERIELEKIIQENRRDLQFLRRKLAAEKRNGF
jgi:hypothetical protein